MKIELKNNILQLRGISFADTDAVFAYFHTAKKKRYEYYQTNRVSINNRIIHGNHMLQEQDTVRIFLAMEEDTIEPWYEDLEILFEDELFCIVNKPANLLVHSDGIEHAHTVCNLVKAHYLLEGHNTCVRPLHRLDYETSGAMIFCKVPFLQPLLDAMLKISRSIGSMRHLLGDTLHRSTAPSPGESPEIDTMRERCAYPSMARVPEPMCL